MATATEISQSSHWHLDKRVPLAIIFTLAVQTGGLIWGAAKIDARLDETERRVIRLESAFEKLAEAVTGSNEWRARIEERQAAQLAVLQEIKIELRKPR